MHFKREFHQVYMHARRVKLRQKIANLTSPQFSMAMSAICFTGISKLSVVSTSNDYATPAAAQEIRETICPQFGHIPSD